jgi:hypothetical protein
MYLLRPRLRRWHPFLAFRTILDNHVQVWCFLLQVGSLGFIHIAYSRQVLSMHIAASGRIVGSLPGSPWSQAQSLIVQPVGLASLFINKTHARH